MLLVNMMRTCHPVIWIKRKFDHDELIMMTKAHILCKATQCFLRRSLLQHYLNTMRAAALNYHVAISQINVL